ncbi:Hypothetical protein PHPALM_20114 [Phytophthora palmivora]|uniref:Uncharacterized protein n=1 Tax=Phytophthora palmivora TaxID=4796 RepID=A0A2P4XFP7_9STRA|nr:Hypothetical protein PHPALM_20114 [Phytophthora palmivora]
MSALDINWLRPVAPDGPKPLQILVDWFALNGVVYHASSHQREVLVPLCRELNARGVQCEVDQILDYVSYLQEVVHDAASLHQELPEDLVPYQEHLQALLFKDGHTSNSVALPSQQKSRYRPTSRLSWLEPSPYGGLSGMEVLVEWLKNNYSTYARATRKGEKGKLLEDLVKEMKGAGIKDCAVNTVRAKIDVLHREVKGEKSRSAAWEQFGSVLEEIFTVGDAGQEREEARNDESFDNQEDGTISSVGIQEHSLLSTTQGSVNSADIFASLKPPVKHKRSSPTSRLAWMKPALPGSPTAMELLVEWMERNYAAYTQTNKKGDKGRMLNKLLHKIEAVGHHGCTIHAIRVKIDSLQRQAGGKARPSSAFDQYGASLRRVFAEKDSIEAIGPREPSPRFTAVEQDCEDSQNSNDEGMESDDNFEEIVTESAKSPDCQNDLVDMATTESVVLPEGGNHSTEDTHACSTTTHEANISSTREVNTHPREIIVSANRSSDSETEDDDREQPAKVKPIVPQERQQISSPTRSPSTSEIVRIATLLRERHDLLQRGVPQEQIDKFLPLPNV